MSDSSAIDQALMDLLLADTGTGGLRTFLPDGVFWEEDGASLVDGGSSKRFILVSLIDARDEAIFEGRGSEDNLYAIKVVALSKINGVVLSPTLVRAAAARVDRLLDPQPPLPRATLTIPGYGLMLLRREARIRFTEVDAVDSSIRWFHRGGHYRLIAAPIFA